MRKLAFFMSVIAALSACAAIALTGKPTAKPVKTPKPTSLVLLYTSSALGQIRSCNCTKFRFGGYGRELSLLKSIRASKSDVLLIEGGDIVGGEGFQARLKTDVAAQALGMLGYGAIIPGDEDLGMDGSPSIKQFEKKPVPIICANLYTKEQHLKYSPFKVITSRNGLRVGVMGLMDKSTVPALLEKTIGYTVTDPKAALAKYLPSLRKQCDMVVLVYHGGNASAEKFAAFKGVDIVLCTHRVDKDILFPSTESNEVDALVDKRGSTYLVKAGTKENWCLGRLDITLGANSKPTSIKHKLIYLDRRYTEDPIMLKVYNAYSGNVTKAVLTESKKFLDQAEVILVKRGLNPDDMRKRLRKSPYATSEACKDCHSEVYEKWSASRHARAIDNLKDTRQEYDPECVTCHVTGAVTRNGYVYYKETPELANVQCEACHGPALEHSKSPKKGFGTVDEQTCRSCHTEERNPDFDYDTYWAKIKH
ncbi:MAG: multiheme c-type cytochrome [Armatimonadetes bacterium]|nr:multiheme c-type cytochrome [Armatimonadota bacterium]